VRADVRQAVELAVNVEDADLPTPDRHYLVAACRKVGGISYDVLIALSRHRGQIGLIRYGLPPCCPRVTWEVSVVGPR
jgi:hypothetical protein